MGISERWQAVAILMCGQVEPVTFHTMARPLWGVHLGKGLLYFALYVYFLFDFTTIP